MNKKTNFAIMACIVSLVFLSALPGFAQEKQEETRVPKKSSVSEAELEQTAKAYAKIIRIQEDFQQSVQQAENDPKKLQAMQEEANEQMTRVVEKEGLDLQTYTNIIYTVKADADLRKEFMEKLEQIE